VSHPTPLHPDADLAVVLDDLRQSVAAWGDEGMVMRVFRAGICLALLSILDTLIDLLADFRAGRLPPVLPAKDEPARRVGFQPTTATECNAADEPSASASPAAASPQRAERRIRAHPTEDASDDPGGACERNTERSGTMPLFARAPAAAPLDFPYPAHPRGHAGHPSVVPRPRTVEFGDPISTHMLAHFVAK
jgi:hypothetical protein